jgi:hypothetical protein
MTNTNLIETILEQRQLMISALSSGAMIKALSEGEDSETDFGKDYRDKQIIEYAETMTALVQSVFTMTGFKVVPTMSENVVTIAEEVHA